MRKQVILDTSVLIVLHHLNLLKYLNLIYNSVLLPKEVINEFIRGPKNEAEYEKTKRYDFLEKFLLENQEWIKKCVDYAREDVEIYLNEGLDKGESEAIAQNQANGNIHEVLIDEKKGRKFAKNLNIRIHGVLYILAVMELKFGIIDYHKSVHKVIKDLNVRFSQEIIDSVYAKVREEFR